MLYEFYILCLLPSLLEAGNFKHSSEMCSHEVMLGMPSQELQEILALDIGTRTIMGVVLQKSARGYHIRAAELYEHKERAMYDGQVHNVAAVAQGVSKVKTILERRRKKIFPRAAVAAAGRTLKMATGQAQRERAGLSEVTAAEVRALELEALRHAQTALTQQEGETAAGFFCVGYSISQYLLEGHPISELVGQVGQNIGVELIATFLPRVVVTGLFAVLQKAGLEPASLTLEPIAALEICVPSGMRQLNLALVDIGAGTADIALVRRGRVFAYAMAPVAGDEITDTLCRQYLLDFDTGETVKRQLSYTDHVIFTDILGQEQQLSSADIISSLQPAIRKVAAEIATEILSLNGGPPDAVLLVGGGSLTPNLPQALAAALELPESRVGIRTRETIASVTGQTKKLSGPQGITPVGIAVTAFGETPLHFVDVTVNGHQIPLWQGAGETVADALLVADGSWTHLFGRPGLALTVEVNGQLKIVPGQQGKAPKILVNQKAASLDTPLRPGDEIEFTPGADGQPAKAKIRDLLPEKDPIIVNGKQLPFEPAVLLNGQPADLDTSVPDRAQITVSWERPIRELLIFLGVEPAAVEEQHISYLLGGRSYSLSYSPCQVHLNGRLASMAELARPGDRLDYLFQSDPPTVAAAIEGHISLEPPVTVTVNGQRLSLPASGTQVLVNGKLAQLEDPLPAQAEITLLPGRDKLILSDLFTLIDIKRQAKAGATLVMLINGEPATFTSPLQHGDQITLTWE